MYISKESGLYEYKTYTKTRITNAAIKQFEKDVEDGKVISQEEELQGFFKAEHSAFRLVPLRKLCTRRQGTACL